MRPTRQFRKKKTNKFALPPPYTSRNDLEKLFQNLITSTSHAERRPKKIVPVKMVRLITNCDWPTAIAMLLRTKPNSSAYVNIAFKEGQGQLRLSFYEGGPFVRTYATSLLTALSSWVKKSYVALRMKLPCYEFLGNFSVKSKVQFQSEVWEKRMFLKDLNT